MAGTLYVVATPLGNLEDMSFRAVRILKEAALIAAEDTRQTAKLLRHFGIETPAVSCHEHNEQHRAARVLEVLASGGSVAVVTDAGTPLISDPGFRLVRAAVDAGFPVSPVPGPCSPVAALSAAGLPTGQFYFAGFLPPKSGPRRTLLESLRSLDCTIAFLEAPHRIVESLADLEATFGAERPVVVARELTKIHEEFTRGTAAEVRADFERRPSVKGEITLLTGPPVGPMEPLGDAKAEVAKLIAEGLPRMDAIKAVAKRHGLPKREVYKLAGE